MKSRARSGRIHRRTFALALLGALLLASPAGAGNPCADCTAPSESDIEGLLLETRRSILLGSSRDYLCVDGGECSYVIGSVAVKKSNWRLEVKASGVAKNCPSMVQSGQVTISIGETDSTGWSVSGSAGANANPFGVGVTAEIVAQLEGAHGLTRATSVSHTFKAGYCKVIVWTAFLEKADVTAEVPVHVWRRYAWWTKNKVTGAKVHQMGNKDVHCGSVTLYFQCLMPLAVHIHTCQTACSDPACSTIPTGEIGFEPPLPKGLEPPDWWRPRYPGPLGPTDASEDEPADDDDASSDGIR